MKHVGGGLWVALWIQSAVIVFISCMSVALLAQSVYAVGWVGKAPTLNGIVPDNTDIITNHTCSNQLIKIQDSETIFDTVGGDTSMCVLDTSKVRFGEYRISGDQGAIVTKTALGFAGDEYMRPLASDIYDWYHSRDYWYRGYGLNDAINLRKDSDGWTTQQLYYYRDVSTGFGFDIATNMYTFHRDAYTYHLARPNGTGVSVFNVAFSDNGKWVVAKSNDVGLIRINLQTLKADRIYQTLDNPSSSMYTNLTISNDGTKIAYRSLIIEVNSRCGSPITDTLSNTYPRASDCPSTDINNTVRSVVEPLAYSAPHFNDDGDVLYVSVDDKWTYHRTVRIKLTAAYDGPEGRTLQYLALGDSYSSGEGDIDAKSDGNGYYIKNTGTVGGCHLSSRSYPYLLRKTWSIDANDMESVACSGAMIRSDYYGYDEYSGQAGHELSSDAQLREAAISSALQNFTPGARRQIDFVDKYKPDIVTFTGGGNDVGFADILKYCASTHTQMGFEDVNSTCSYVTDHQLRADLNRTIDDQYDSVKAFTDAIHLVSPMTRVYIIGYPQFISQGLLCNPQSPILDVYEIKMIRESVSRLNNQLKRAARDAGVYYIDIEDSLAGGQICDGSRYMTGPLKLGYEKLTSGKLNESYHPNALGHQKIAKQIDRAINLDEDYQIIDIPYADDGRRTISKVVMPEYTGIGSTRTITMDSSMFMPDGTVTIEMFSNKVTLATVQADQDGNFIVDVRLPESITPGVHLLTLSGEDIYGDPLVVRQFITVMSSLPDDIDGDGILDEDDTCNFITSWYQDGKDICRADTTLTMSLNSKATPEQHVDKQLLQQQSDPNTVQETVDPVHIKESNRHHATKESTEKNTRSNTALKILVVASIIILIVVAGGMHAKKTSNKN